MSDFKELRKYKDLFDICGKCGDCGTSGTQITTAKRHVSKPCPIKNVLGFEAYDARGRILILKNLLNNNLKISNEILEWAHTCTGCGSCKETCLAIEGGIDTPSLMEAFRQDLINQGMHLEKSNQILESVLKNQNPYGEPRSNRHQFLDGKYYKENAEYLLFLGCTSSYRQQEIARSTVMLLENIGVDFSLLENEPCCGSILKRHGHIKEFKEIARANLKLLEDAKVTNVVFPCAGCYRTFKVDYEEFNTTSIQFYHLAEFLEQHVRENSSSFKLKQHKKISYHDPCHLGRHAGVYEAPRNLLKEIKNSTFIELDALRNYSHCCGAGGGVKSTNPELAVQVAYNRNKEALDKSIEILVSACPFCERNLKDGLNGAASQLQILDISELLLQSFEKDLKSQIINKDASQSKEVTKYMEFLSQYPEIFSDLVDNSVLDFAIYDSIESMDEENPIDVFHVVRNEQGIEIIHGKADDADLELAVSTVSVEKLTQTKTKSEYAKLFGSFYNDPDEDEGWIDFVLHKRTKTLIDMGYGKFAEEAGILEDENNI